MPTIKRKTTYILLAAFTVLLAIYITIFIVSKYYLNGPEVKRMLSAQVEEKLQRKINLSDDIGFSISWDMSPHIKLKNVTLSNWDSSKHANMVSIETLDLNFSLWALIIKQIHINSIKLVKPVIYLEKNAKKANWEFNQNTAVKTEAKANDSSSVNLHVHKISIIDGSVSYTENNQATKNLAIKSLTVISSSANQDFEVEFVGAFNKIPLKLNVNASLTDNEIELDLIEVESGQSDINGNLLIKRNPLVINGELNSTLLRVSDFVAPSASSSNSSGEYQIPDLQLPIENLKNAEIKLPIKIKKLVLNKLTLKDISININNKNNAVNINLEPGLNIAGGKIDFAVNYDLKPNTPTLKLDLTAKDLQLDTLLTLVSGQTPVKGSLLQVNTNLISNGTNLRTIVNNLDGRFLATISKGQFLNSKDLNASLFAMLLSASITFDKRESSTDLNCAVFNMHVNNGTATAKNSIGLEAASVNVLGSGKIDLHNGRIDFTIKPQNVSTNSIDLSVFSVAQLIKINGTISKPSVSLNPLGLLDPTGSATKALLTNLAMGLPGNIAVAAKGLIDPAKPTSTLSPCKAALAN